MTSEQVVSGVGIFTLTFSWNEGRGNVQWVRGGIWGNNKVEVNEHVIGALEVALQNARKELMAAVVEATTQEAIVKMNEVKEK